MKQFNLNRFHKAQETDYETALSEIRSGRKRSHWMWYIFPQLKGLGMSHMSDYYGLDGIEEARAYIQDPVLAERLHRISAALLDLTETDPGRIMGYPDDRKLLSCMTLFSLVSDDPVYLQVLDRLYKGRRDARTLKMAGAERKPA